MVFHPKPITLSPRGHRLATGPASTMRAMFEQIMLDQYDPDKNPDGIPPEPSRPTNSATARHMNKHFHPHMPITERELLIANGVGPTCEMLGFCLFDPGEGLLMGRPIYQSFEEGFGTRAGVRAVWVGFPERVDQFAPECVGVYEEALRKAQEEGVVVRALLLCNPHNPLGRCYPKETIVALMRFCAMYGLHLVADEVYAVSVYEEEATFTSVISFDCSEYIAPQYVHVMYGLSKDFAAGGLRVGCLYTVNQELWMAMSAITMFVWSGAVDGIVATEILEDEEWLEGFFAESKKTLKSRFKLTKQLLRERDVGWYEGSCAGFFLWADFSRYLSSVGKEDFETEMRLFEKFVKSKVVIIPGGMLRCEEPGWFRIMFAQDGRILREGMKRVFQTLDELTESPAR
ncbi:hypothetical protein M409DRAFT_25022 [Zasmidium cellare ATCC 36951]|uniref:Aminotransferase class I/classII large domain-containing protein n=1 Tax=Zasmidium cellare ATCC 36951 TaxID=1080233 RepID=A0A6A6CC51_ZASCE|nr:uncharacterized protein M409DRAFT_25022 [Zasmidium cellare ATCC 36951]KAF2164625.1 hypothetical protein M409DRAFT_25022 [Zasmidium cellare ATCC 36951]